MSKFIIINVVKWFLKSLKKPSKTYPEIFKKSAIFVLFVIALLILIKLLQFSIVWVLLLLLIIEFFNWLSGKHD
mgnify:CR=1 FL=1|jgi:hypothetical protein